MQLIETTITLQELFKMSEKMFDDLVKAVVDIETQDFMVDADLHSDLERILENNGSKSENLWGINLYPQLYGTEDFIEFDSMINLKPMLGNRTRSVENKDIQKIIRNIVNKKVIQ